ncbi:MAG: tRNA (adenosine(37)-N6)-threonylcarbamoyltransferase complex dimerization subunit type 1 TsaB [Spirochaetota bacterium]
MNTLIIDTSSENLIVCVRTPHGTVDASERTGLVHAANLLDALDRTLNRAAVPISALTLVGCGIGPGSFTGIRISVTTCRMISQLTKVPVVGLRSQRLYTLHPVFVPGDLVLVAYDAKKKRVFGGLYKTGDDPLSPEVIVEEGDYPMEHLLDFCTGRPLYAVGNGCRLYADKVRDTVPECTFLDDHMPDPAMTCAYAEMMLSNGNMPSDYTALRPFYARLSDAEAAKLGKKTK